MKRTDPIGRLLYGVVAAVAVVPLAASPGCSKSQAAATAATDDRLTVAVARAARADLTETLTLAAEFRPFEEIDVHAKVAGYVKAIYVDVGSRVKTGELLAVLEIPELQDEARQDEANVQRSAEEINRARADLERTESAHEVAHLAATRLAGVIKARPNLVAQQEIDDATAKDRMAEAQTATAKAALASAEQQLGVARAMAAKTKTLVDYTRIIAPFAGVVTHRYADTGAMIQAGTSSQTQAMPIVKLSATDRLRLTIAVPESAVAHVRVGAPVDVRVDAVRRTFTGSVARFAGKVDADTRTMATEVDVQNTDRVLVPGMYAYVSLALAGAKDVVAVPVQALDRAEDKTTVLVVDRGTIVRRTISVGLETPDRVEVTSGVADGDLVVIGNRSQLREGAVVATRLAAADGGTR
ncbi:MAG TPA: efflux RND transporter periplasmic adaptor subunit [Vicinamibacterales bacterium]|nr:efflux RND transporter periplasmic adaptor subunit [Vicinamibacterales bacterium]